MNNTMTATDTPANFSKSEVSIQQRCLGVNFSPEGEAEVRVWAPLAKSVSLCLKADDTQLPMEKVEFGYWESITNRLKPGDLYKFVLDGEKERPDPASLSQPESVHGASQALDIRRFPWTDQSWKNPLLEDYILYELHTGTFTSEGTFAGIEQKLDYLKELGITAIEIMPVAQFPGNRNWGYDGVYPFAVQDSYGGAEGLQHLVDVCHRKGLAVVLDVVYNHLGPDGNYLREYGPYFTSQHCTPWGDAINYDDSWCDGARRFVIENALMWFRDFHIDALRLDAVHAIKDFSAHHILQEIKEYTDRLMQETGRTHYLIVESDLNDTRLINPIGEGGYGMDAQWMDEFHHSLRVTAGQERQGYYADFNGIAHLAKSFKDVYVYDGQYSEARLRTFGTKVQDNPGQQFIVFSQNHDQVGNRMLGERTSRLVSFSMQKLLASVVITSPYLPMLFMGEEWGEPNPFLYFVSHTDLDLVEAIRKGRKEEFASFHAQGETPDPQAEETFVQSRLQWNLLDQDPHRTLLRYYRTLIALRKELPALRSLDRKQVAVEADEARETLLLLRRHADGPVLCLMNFSKEEQSLRVPTEKQQWEKRLDSADQQWAAQEAGSRTAAPDSAPAGATVTLQPESFVIYA